MHTLHLAQLLCYNQASPKRLPSACEESLAHNLSNKTGTSQLRTGACTDFFTPTQNLLCAARTLSAHISHNCLPPTNTAAPRSKTQQPHVGKHACTQGIEEPCRAAPFASASGLPAGEFSAASARALSGLEPARQRHQRAQHGTAWRERSSGALSRGALAVRGTSAAALAHARGVLSSQGTSLVRVRACSRRGVMQRRQM